MRCYRCGAVLGGWTDTQGWYRRWRRTGRGYRCEDRGACAGRRARQAPAEVEVEAPTLDLD